MSDAVWKEVPLSSVDYLIDLTKAKVVDTLDITEEDYIGRNFRRDGGLFLILELNTGERCKVFCPFLAPSQYPPLCWIG